MTEDKVLLGGIKNPLAISGMLTRELTSKMQKEEVKLLTIYMYITCHLSRLL